MLRTLTILGLLSSLNIAYCQLESPIEVVQKQLDTYNAQDIDGFSKVFSRDAQIFFNLGDSAASLTGRAQIKERYGSMFKSNPDNRSTLMGRLVQGNFVFDHELITGRDEELKIVAIYEVQNGLIQRCWFAR